MQLSEKKIVGSARVRPHKPSGTGPPQGASSNIHWNHGIMYLESKT